MGDLTEDFSKWEFACLCGKCGMDGGHMSKEYITTLQVVRGVYGKRIDINSGERCPAHNKDVGGKDDSEHLEKDGFVEAGDIEISSSSERYELLPLLILNFPRIGIGDGFVHTGVRKSRAQNVAWVYGPKKKK